MAPSTKSPRVRVSKNKKKSWRKYSDIKDVEEFLEKKRFEERIGGAVSEKRDDELFFVHTKRDKTQIKLRHKSQELRCHQILNSYSMVEPPKITKKGITKKRKEILARIEKKQLARVTRGDKLRKKKPEEMRDLWAEDEKNVDPEIAELANYGAEIMKKRPVKVPNHRYQKPSLLPSVEVPHPGASYNPDFEDHQNLLRDALVIEEKREKEELHLKRVLDDMYPSKEDAPTEETWLAEMSQGLEDAEVEGEANDDAAEVGSNVLTLNPPVTTEGRKSRSQKKKEKARKEMERLRLIAKRKKLEMHQVFRIRGIMSEIRAQEKKSEVTQEKTEQKKMDRMYTPHILGKYKYVPNDLEVNLSEELRGSLRELKTEGNILEDRYKSLQRRNIIEPRIKQKKVRKYKLKRQIKRSHRDFE